MKRFIVAVIVAGAAVLALSAQFVEASPTESPQTVVSRQQVIAKVIGAQEGDPRGKP
jgi:hypothetical protein